MKLDRKQDLNVLYQVYAFRVDKYTTLAALANPSKMLHFVLRCTLCGPLGLLFRVMADFNPRRQYIGVDLFELLTFIGSSGGRVVKLLACGARGPGFDSRPRHLNFQRLVISCFQVKIWLKDR